jgi:hypothetical protein
VVEGAKEVTPDEVKSKVRAVLALMKPEWRFMAWCKNFGWSAFANAPSPYDNGEHWILGGYCTDVGDFDLPSFPGDWRESLVTR